MGNNGPVSASGSEPPVDGRDDERVPDDHAAQDASRGGEEQTQDLSGVRDDDTRPLPGGPGPYRPGPGSPWAPGPPPPHDPRFRVGPGGPPGHHPGRPLGPPRGPLGPPPGFRPGHPLPYGAPAARPRQRTVGAWVVPVSIAAALVTGLVGGLLGGGVLLGLRSDDSGLGGPLPPLERTEPLERDNASVAAVAARLLPSTVQVRVDNGGGAGNASGASGSGFVVDRRGHVITNNHVVEVADDDAEIDVVDNNGRVRSATIVGRSPVYDIAVLDVDDPAGLRPAALGSSRRMEVGETVVAIGSPLGLSSTVTSGIVSALDRPVSVGAADESSYINAVQTDAAINPGNSGGPLVNLRGQVVGVNSAIATTGGGFGGQGGNIGVGFAIPMEQVRYTASQILEEGEAEYPVIGATVQSSEDRPGADIVEVPGGTPASSAGLQEGDRVVAVNDVLVPDANSLIVKIRSFRPGDDITLTVVRDGDEQRVTLTLDGQVG
jgi:putative serine protease PepD